MAPFATNLTAEKFKNEGNDHFRKHDYEKAITLYDKAIKQDPNQVAYYTNRATAFFKLHEQRYPNLHSWFKTWLTTPEYEPDHEESKAEESTKLLKLVLQDSRKALSIDCKNLKAYYYFGLVAFMFGKLHEAWGKFVECYRLAIEAQSPSLVDVMNFISKLRVKLCGNRKNISLKSEGISQSSTGLSRGKFANYENLHFLLNISIQSEYNANCNNIISQYDHIEDDDYQKASFRRNPKFQKQIEDQAKRYHDKLKDADDLFNFVKEELNGNNTGKRSDSSAIDSKENNVTTSDKSKQTNGNNKTDAKKDGKLKVRLDVPLYEIPEYLIDPVKYGMMTDPVITIYGESYERKNLVEFVAKHHIDPVVKKPLELNQIYPNKSLKLAIQKFVEEHKITK